MAAVGELLYKIGVDTEQAEQNINSTTGAIAGFGATLGGVVGAKQIVELGSDFETSMAKVGTVTDASDEELAEFEEGLLSLSSQYGISATEMAEATYQALSAGVELEDMLGFLEVATQLSIGGFTDLTTAVDLLTTVINAYGLETADAAHIADVLITTQNEGKTTIDELGASMALVIPVAASMNVSLENLSAAMAILTKNGISTTVATTQLKAMLTELGKEGTEASINLEKAAKSAGIAETSFADMMEAGMSLGDVMVIMTDYAEENDKAMIDLFGSIEAGSAAMVIGKTDVEDYNAILLEMEEGSGAAAEASAEMSAVLEQQTSIAVTTLKNEMIKMYDAIQPLLIATLEFINTHVKLIPILLKTTMVFLAFLSALFIFGVVIPMIINTTVKLTKTMGKLTKAVYKGVKAIVKQIYSWTVLGLQMLWVATKAIATFLKQSIIMISKIMMTVWALLLQAVAWAIANWWIVLIGIGIGILIMIIIYLLKNFDILLNILKLLIEFFIYLWEVLIKFIKIIAPPLITAFEAIIEVLGKLLDFIIEMATIVWEVMKDLIEKMSDAWTAFKDLMQEIWDAIVKIVKFGVNNIIRVLNVMLEAMEMAAGAMIWTMNLVPGIDIAEPSFKPIPLMAEGGVVDNKDGGTLAMIGEGANPEAVVPLTPKGISAFYKGVGMPSGEQTIVLQPQEIKLDGKVIAKTVTQIIKVKGGFRT